MRVYAVRPQLDRPAERLRHRFISAGSIREHGEERVCDLLRRALAQDVHFWQSMLRIDDVKRLNRESTHVKRVAELKERYQDEALEDMLAAEEKANGYERDLEFALEENARLREENYQLESRCQSYEAVFGKRGGAGRGGGRGGRHPARRAAIAAEREGGCAHRGGPVPRPARLHAARLGVA